MIPIMTSVHAEKMLVESVTSVVRSIPQHLQSNYFVARQKNGFFVNLVFKEQTQLKVYFISGKLLFVVQVDPQEFTVV